MRDPLRWSIGSKFVVPNLDDATETYLTRWRLLQTPWFGIYLHRMDGPDSRPTLHDHPWNFVALVLKGGYLEKRLNPKDMSVFVRVVRRFNAMRTHDAHAILDLHETPTWTLVVTGPRVRTWGYLEQNTFVRCETRKVSNGEVNAMIPVEGWQWTEHDRHFHQQEFNAAMKARALQK